MNPVILYDNRFNDAAPTATATAAGFDVLNIRDGRAYTFWQGPAAGTHYITVNCGAAKAADALGIIGHNLKTAGATVTVESSPDNAVWTPRTGAYAPTNDRAFMQTFVKIYAQYWRLKIVSTLAAPRLAVAMIGARLEFPWPPDTPYIPYTERVETDSKRGKSGNLLGSVVRYKPIEVNARFSNFEREWVFDDYQTFWDSHASEMKQFFYAWDLDNFPEHAFFLKLQDDARWQTPVSILSVVDSLELPMEGVKEL